MTTQDPTKQYRYSFSGADARAFVYFEGLEANITELESLHTFSTSVHEAKGQGRALGFRGIKGLARGIRTVAGSMILTVIEDNPLRPILNQISAYDQEADLLWPGWSVDRHETGTGTALNGTLDFGNRIAPLIPPFNMLVEYVSEGALWSPKGSLAYAPIIDQDEIIFDQGVREAQVEGAGLLLRGIEFIDEGVVTSSNDIVTEVTLSFIAHDLKPISAQAFASGSPLFIHNEDERKNWELRQKLFGERQVQRTTQQETALQTVQRARFEY